jgi:ribosome-associated translation inhibitor RaiA
VKNPLQITFRDIDPSASVEARIRDHAAKLDELHDGIVSCRVMVETSHRHHHKGRLYHVRIDLTMPGAELVVSRDPEDNHAREDVYVAIRDAFDAARRRLQNRAQRQRGEVKAHSATVSPEGPA